MRDESLPINNKALLPSGRVPIEDVVSFVITELAVKPLQPEWQVTIQKAREAFMAYKTW